MDLIMTETISRRKWLAALGVRGDADDRLACKIKDAEALLKETAEPRAVYRIMKNQDIDICGYSMAKHLEGCSKAAVMAVTLGAGVDKVLRKMQVTDMAMAVIMDCGASVLAECLCDDFEGIIKSEVKRKAKDIDEGRVFFTPRFSPGYGDSPLAMQKEIVSYVDGQRRIGINVTSENLLIPRKSITAILGISDYPVVGRLATCDECVLREKCILRKEGKFCGD